jgi:hypothetical protein
MVGVLFGRTKAACTLRAARGAVFRLHPKKVKVKVMVDNSDEFEGNADVRRQLQQQTDAVRCALCQHFDGQQVPTLKGTHTVKVIQVGGGNVCTDCAGLAANTTGSDLVRLATGVEMFGGDGTLPELKTR